MRRIGLATAALLTPACSSPALPSTTIIIPPPAITCPVAPAPVTTNGQPAVVTYGSATATGGTTPVSVSCTPPSGSAFAFGSTAVTCTATDAVRRTASCSFTAIVTLPSPRLGVTSILAFGDSLTEGEVPVAGEFGIRPQFVEPDKSYPADLTTFLAQRYTAQGASRIDAFTASVTGGLTDCTPNPPAPTTSGIVVVNAGCLGEAAGDPATLPRLNTKITAYHPDLVLLLEGTNDLDPLNPATSISNGVLAIQTLVGAVRSRGIPVMVGTLPPQIGADLTHGGTPGLIVPFNTQLVPVATGAGAQVVDLYGDLVMDVTDWISPYDGFHLTEAGYQEMARLWFTSIRNTFELPPSMATSTSSSAHPNTGMPGRLKR